MFSNINPKLAEPQHISSRHGLHSVNFDDHKWPMASPCWGTKHMEVSWNRGTPKSSIFSRFFYSKPFILGYPHLWKPPYEQCSKPSVIPAYCILLLRILDPLSTWSVFCCKWTPRGIGRYTKSQKMVCFVPHMAHQPWKIAAARHLGIPRAAIQQTHQVLSPNIQRVLSINLNSLQRALQQISNISEIEVSYLYIYIHTHHNLYIHRQIYIYICMYVCM